MRRCCEGETYVLDNRAPGDDGPSYAVKCLRCDAVLAVVDVPREEVYYSL